MAYKVQCPYCLQRAKLTTSKEVYPNHGNHYPGFFYLCSPCDAYVGCHPGTSRPLGSPANYRLRQLRSQAHRVFDEIWRGRRGYSRGKAYRWLAKQFDVEDIHIGESNEDQCLRIIEVAKTHPYLVGRLEEQARETQQAMDVLIYGEMTDVN